MVSLCSIFLISDPYGRLFDQVTGRDKIRNSLGLIFTPAYLTLSQYGLFEIIGFVEDQPNSSEVDISVAGSAGLTVVDFAGRRRHRPVTGSFSRDFRFCVLIFGGR